MNNENNPTPTPPQGIPAPALQPAGGAPAAGISPKPDVAETIRQVGERARQNAADWTQAAKEKSAQFLEAQKRQMERNPTRALLEALAIGFVAGLLIRLITGGERNAGTGRVDVEHRPTLDEAKFHLGSVFLPFLWPTYKKARYGYDRSAEKIEHAANRVRKTDFRKAGREKAKQVEDWIDDEVLPVVEQSKKRVRKLFS